MDHPVIPDVDSYMEDLAVSGKGDDIAGSGVGYFILDPCPLPGGGARDVDAKLCVGVLGQAGTVKPAFFPGFSTENVGRTQKLSAS